MDIFKKIIDEYKLGQLVEPPIKVIGGLTHTTYKLVTTTNTYIIKLLNPNIMKRETALSNFKKADELEIILLEHKINILPSLTFNNKKLQKLDEQYFYIFEYFKGKSLNHEEIKEEHCKLIANELSKIHNIEIKEEKYLREEININWLYYLEIAKEKNKDVYNILVDKIDILKESMIKGNQSIKKVPSIVTICHNDMDSKNILWNEKEFKIIDLECLNYSNPYIEFFQIALCWSGYEICNINYNLLEKFIKEYNKNHDITKIDWEIIYYSNYGRLEWLEFNLKRSFMIECDSKEEQEIGIKEVKETLNHIIYYDKIKEKLLKEFNKIKKQEIL